MSSPYPQLREILASGSSRSNFRTICQLLSEWPDEDQPKVALEYAQEHMGHWPPQHRLLHSPGPDHPCWPLARGLRWGSVDIEAGAGLPLEQIERHAIEALELARCPELRDIGALSGLAKLQSLTLHKCPRLRHVDALASMTGLRQCCLFECTGLEALPPLQDHGQLWRFEMTGPQQPQTLDLSALPPSLSHLNLAMLPQLQSLEGLGSLVGLRFLNVNQCPELYGLTLTGLDELRHLAVTRCEMLDYLDDLEQCTGLQSFRLDEAMALERPERLSGLSGLRSLVLGDCGWDGWSLGCLEAMTELRELHLEECEELRGEVSLAAFPQLRSLTLTGCGVESLDLSHNRSLRHLSLMHASELRQIEGLEGLEELKILQLHTCESLEVQPSLSLMGAREAVEQYQARLRS